MPCGTVAAHSSFSGKNLPGYSGRTKSQLQLWQQLSGTIETWIPLRLHQHPTVTSLLPLFHCGYGLSNTAHGCASPWFHESRCWVWIYRIYLLKIMYLENPHHLWGYVQQNACRMWFKFVAISVRVETALPRGHLLHHSLVHGPSSCSPPNTGYPDLRAE